MLKMLKKSLRLLERYLEEKLFINFPQLPDYATRPLIKYLSGISLVLGLLCLYSAYNLWWAANNVSSLINYANKSDSIYGIPKMAVDNHTGLAFWLGILALLIEAFLFFRAFRQLRNKSRSAWNLIYYAFILNVVYGFIMLFSTYSGTAIFIERLFASIICLYFLFEIRDSFKTVSNNKPRNTRKT